MKHPLFAALVVAALAAGCAQRPTPTVAPRPLTPPKSGVKALKSDLASYYRTQAFENAVWGVLVKSLSTGETLYSLNPGTFLMPASNMKVVTMAAALSARAGGLVIGPLIAVVPALIGRLAALPLCAGWPDHAVAALVRLGQMMRFEAQARLARELREALPARVRVESVTGLLPPGSQVEISMLDLLQGMGLGLVVVVFFTFLPLSRSYEHMVGGFLLPSIGMEVVYSRGADRLSGVHCRILVLQRDDDESTHNQAAQLKIGKTGHPGCGEFGKSEGGRQQNDPPSHHYCR